VLALAVGQLAIVTWASLRGYLFADDYYALPNAAESALDSAYLLRNGAGHLSPGTWLLWWLWAELFGYQHTAIVLTITVMLAIYLGTLWALVRAIAGHTWGAVGVFVVGATSTMLLPSTLWIANAVSAVPMNIAIAAGLCLHVLGWRRQRPALLVAAGAVLFAGLMFWEKVAFLPVLAGLLTLAWPGEGGPRARVGVVLRLWPAWVAYFVAGGAYLLLRSRRDYSAGSFDPSFDGFTDYLGQSLVHTVSPQLVGGPIRWQPVVPGQPLGLVDTPAAFVAYAAVVVVTVAVWSVWRQRSVAWVWLVLLAYLGLGYLLVAVGRLGVLGADVVARDARYLSDVPVAVAAVLALVVATVRAADASAVTRRTEVVASTLLTALVAVASVMSTLAYAAIWSDSPTRPYLTTLLRDLASAPTPTNAFDGTIPPAFLDVVFPPYNQLSRFLAPVDDRPQFDQPSGPHFVVRDDGTLVPGVLAVTASTAQPQCGTGTVVSSPAPVDGPDLVTVEVAYRSDTLGPATLSVGNASATRWLQAGEGRLIIGAPGPVSTVQLTMPAAATAQLCIDQVLVGRGVAADMAGGAG